LGCAASPSDQSGPSVLQWPDKDMALSSTCLKNGILEIRITDLGCYALIKKKEQKKKE
jgi:hypothetical protein